ncbi:hypothetical protein [Leifsonia sp. NPDC058230]|uniref:hypothetical protein n=1 Tax=Leifsonia sp. NPDC058230 TaxID=3346391 RepID=UPI0036D77677
MPGPNGPQLARHPLLFSELTLVVTRIAIASSRPALAGPQLLVACATTATRSLAATGGSSPGAGASLVAIVATALLVISALAITATTPRSTSVPARPFRIAGGPGTPVSTGPLTIPRGTCTVARRTRTVTRGAGTPVSTRAFAVARGSSGAIAAGALTIPRSTVAPTTGCALAVTGMRAPPAGLAVTRART